MPSNEDFWSELDRIGATQVRMNLASNVYLGGDRSLVMAWLERHKATNEAEQALQIRRSNVLSAAAVLIAALSLAVSALALFWRP